MPAVGAIANVDYPTVDAYESRAAVVKLLDEFEYVVVLRDGEFAGVVTAGDTIANPYKLAIDCVGEKAPVDYDSEVEQVLELMESSGIAVAPVFRAGVFHGVAGYRDIIRHLLAQVKETVSVYNKLERLDALTLVSAGIAHDLNNVLTAMQNQCFLLSRIQDLPEDAAEGIAQITQGIRMAANMTRDLQTFSKNGFSRRGSSDCLAENVRKTIEFFLTGRGVRLLFTAQADMPDAAIDPSALAEVVGNLTVNAVHAMPEGGGLEVSISTTRFEAADNGLSPGTYVQIVVRDTGEGIDEQDLPQIFEPRYTTKESGSGLGLAVCRSIVEGVGGRIFARSPKEGGAEFTILLPPS